MRLLVSGSHGLVGKALLRDLSKDGHEIVSLVRRSALDAREIEWHPNQGSIDADHIRNFDVVVHLAGESIASGRWTDEKKRKIRESRIKGTTLLSDTLAQLETRPATFVCASAIGYYGDRADELLTEASKPGRGFLPDVCVAWEKATEVAATRGVRVVNTRFGIILDDEGGALEKMLTPFRMGVGGRVGDGNQWMSWIALDDVIRGLRFVIDNSAVRGPVNFVAPKPVTNADFTKALGDILSRPTLFSIPAFAARIAFGEMAEGLLLASAKVEPKCLIDRGFTFQYPELRKALQHILK